MKKQNNFLVLSFLLVVATSNAQIYFSHYLDQTSEWRYYGGGLSNNNADGISYRTIFFDGTEDYGGYTYYKERMFTVIKYYDLYTNDYLYQDDYYPTTYNLVREDAQGRFYRRPYFDYTTEEMYQDNVPIQNSQIGDNFPSLPDFNFGVCPVVTIEQLSIAGLNLKRLMGYNNTDGGLIEGVGPKSQACGAGGGGLVCYTKQGESLIFEPGTDCSIFPIPVLANETFLKKPIAIYPNPTAGVLNILCNDTIEQLQLFDVQGRRLQSINNTTSIDLSLVPQGIYLLEIKTDKGNAIQKITKN